METDEELYARVRRGDLTAFDVLYERYSSRLFVFLRAMLRNRQDAEDVFHEAFMRALKNPAAGFEGGSFRSWLYRIARNAALNLLRSEQRGARARARLDLDEAPPRVDRMLEESELRRALESAVTRLPPTLLEVYHLRTSGLSYEEMASVLEIPMGTIKSRMNQLTVQLKEELRPWTAK
jgi:RNA polymerase sigma factor (sigma-70 family)